MVMTNVDRYIRGEIGIDDLIQEESRKENLGDDTRDDTRDDNDDGDKFDSMVDEIDQSRHGLERLVANLGYSNLEEFFDDNPGAIEAICDFVREHASVYMSRDEFPGL